MAFAEHSFRHGRQLADGATEGEHRSSAARQWEALGRTKAASAASPEAPSFPDELSYLWAWFNELSAGLAITGMGPSVLTWEGLAAWCGLMRMRLEPWEASSLVNLSLLRASIQSEKQGV
jgi:hypothetical protein